MSEIDQMKLVREELDLECAFTISETCFLIACLQVDQQRANKNSLKASFTRSIFCNCGHLFCLIAAHLNQHSKQRSEHVSLSV